MSKDFFICLLTTFLRVARSHLNAIRNRMMNNDTCKCVKMTI